MNSVHALWRRKNLPFELNEHQGPSEGPYWEVGFGRLSVLLCSVHGVRHRRGGEESTSPPKANDANTGGLVRTLSNDIQCSYAIVLRTEPWVDANSDLAHPLKLELALSLPKSGVRSVVDIHGMTDHHKVDIAIGLSSNEPSSTALADLIATPLEEAGFRVDRDGSTSGLQARGAGTMTTWAQQLGYQAIQVEIAKRCRSFRDTSPEQLCLLYGALRRGLLATTDSNL